MKKVVLSRPSDNTDEELLTAMRGGDRRAFGELWVRHSRAGLRAAQSFKQVDEPDDLVAEAFTRIYTVVQNGGGPTGAFRPYLYTTIRNLSLQSVRTLLPIGNVDLNTIAAPEVEHGSTDLGLDRALTAKAFYSLPERWQSVLWYTEVEQMSPVEAGKILGLGANAVSALAFRARGALRGAWLQSHINDETLSGEHKVILARAGEYSQGTLNARDAKRIDQHLKSCERCTLIVDEVDAVAGRLAIILLPLLLGGTGALILAHAISSGAALPALSAALIAQTPASGSGVAGSTAGSTVTSSTAGAAGAGLSMSSIALIAAAAVVVLGGGSAAALAIVNLNATSPSTTSSKQAPGPSGGPTASPNPVSPLGDSTPVPGLPKDPTAAQPIVTVHTTVATPPFAQPSVNDPLPVQVAPSAPALPILRPPIPNNPTVLIKRSSNTFTGSGTPGATILSDGVPVALVTSSGKWSFGANGFPEGLTRRELSQRLDGYQDSATREITITVDTIAPAAPVVTMNWAPTQAQSPHFNGTAEPGATVRIFAPNGSKLAEVIADGSGKWNFGILIGLTPTMTNLTVTQTDLAGNTSPSAVVGPFAFVPEFAPGLDGTSTPRRFVPFSVAGWPGSALTITLNGAAFGPFFFDSSGEFGATLSDNGAPLAPGVYTLGANYAAATSSADSSIVTFIITP